MGARSSMSHQKGSRVKADMGALGLGSSMSLKRFLGWKIGNPVVITIQRAVCWLFECFVVDVHITDIVDVCCLLLRDLFIYYNK